MHTILLGARNVFRNVARAVLVIIVLGLSVGLFVTMVRTARVTAARAQVLKTQAATLIEVNEAGNSVGYAGTIGIVGTPARELPADVSAIRAIPHVLKVERYVRRQFNNNQKKPPTGVLIGVESGSKLRLTAMGAYIGDPKIIAGRDLTPQDEGQLLALVGKAFAEREGVSIGDEFLLPGPELEKGTKWVYPHAITDARARVIGIFSVGVVYGDNQIFVPLTTTQQLLGISKEKVTQYWITVDSAEHVRQVVNALKELLGPSADVIPNDEAADLAARSFDALSANSHAGAAVTGMIGALVTLFTMVLVTRERTREIGILKAIGASSANVVSLFTAETLVLAAVSGGLGGLIYWVGAPTLTLALFGAVGGELFVGPAGVLSFREILYGLSLVMAFSLVGSSYSVVRAITLRPSEAMRSR